MPAKVVPYPYMHMHANIFRSVLHTSYLCIIITTNCTPIYLQCIQVAKPRLEVKIKV